MEEFIFKNFFTIKDYDFEKGKYVTEKLQNLNIETMRGHHFIKNSKMFFIKFNLNKHNSPIYWEKHEGDNS